MPSVRRQAPASRPDPRITPISAPTRLDDRIVVGAPSGRIRPAVAPTLPPLPDGTPAWLREAAVALQGRLASGAERPREEVVWERRALKGPDGPMSVSEKGDPAFWSEDWGRVPLDDEWAVLADGSRAEVSGMAWGEGRGTTTFVSSILRQMDRAHAPGFRRLRPYPRRFVLSPKPLRPPRLPTEGRSTWRFVIDAPATGRPVPPWKSCRSAASAEERARLGRLRREILAEHEAAARVALAPIEAKVESLGGRVLRRTAGPFATLVAELGAAALDELRRDPRVWALSPADRPGTPDRRATAWECTKAAGTTRASWSCSAPHTIARSTPGPSAWS